MASSLSDAPRVRYSNRERDIFGALPPDGSKVTTLELIRRLWPGDNPPFHARLMVVSSAKSLARKIEFNDEPFRLRRSKASGPYPLMFWLEDK